MNMNKALAPETQRYMYPEVPEAACMRLVRVLCRSPYMLIIMFTRITLNTHTHSHTPTRTCAPMQANLMLGEMYLGGDTPGVPQVRSGHVSTLRFDLTRTS